MINIESFGIIPLRQEEGEWRVLLILHKEGNHWGFPKGKADPGETALQAATRELQEETGLLIHEVLMDHPLIEQYQFRRKRETVIKKVHYFPALITGSLILQESEIRDAKWLTIQEAMKQLSFEQARRILRECMKSMS